MQSEDIYILHPKCLFISGKKSDANQKMLTAHKWNDFITHLCSTKIPVPDKITRRVGEASLQLPDIIGDTENYHLK